MIGTLGFAFVAGLLSTLSPCVLPLIPIILASAVSQHRFGPVALSAGLALSFTAIGIFVATVGFAAGIDATAFRFVAAIILIGLGVTLLVPMLQTRLAVAAGPVSNFAQSQFGGFSTTGLSGQFGVGLLMGAVWTPCVGPTLGAAAVAASQSENLGAVAITMGAFGIGAALPLLLLGMLSREALLRWRGRLGSAGNVLKPLFGALLVIAGLLMLSGLDKRIETALVNASPAWLTTLTTQF